MDVPLEGLLAAFQVVAGAATFLDNVASLATRSGLRQRVAEWLKADPQRREFTRAWESARGHFAEEYPGEAKMLFTSDRLQTIVPRFLERYQEEGRIEALAEHLALAWAETLPEVITHEQQSKLQEMASRFLALLGEELGRQPSFRELIKVQTLQEISRSSAETSSNTADILQEVRSFTTQQRLRISQDVGLQGRSEGGNPTAEATISSPADDFMLAPPANFLGRLREVEWGLDRLHRLNPCFLSLYGLGGIGKTSLAAAIIRQARQGGRFSGGVAVVNCDDMPNGTAILRAALSRFQLPSELADKPLQELLATAGDLFHNRDALVVLDDVLPGLGSSTAIQTLLKLGVSVLATSRQLLPEDLGGSEARLEVGLLPSDDALCLFAVTFGRVGPEEFSETEDRAARAIVDLLGCHTLAVKLAAAYARDYGRDLTALVEELRAPERVLGLPEGGEYGVVAKMVEHSVEHLDPNTRRLFTGLAAFGTLEFSRNAAIVLGIGLGLTKEQVERAIDTLVHRALVSSSTDTLMPQASHRERLQLHPILGAFSRRDFQTWSDEEKQIALLAVATYYRYYVENRPLIALARDEANIISALSWAHEAKQAWLVAPLCMRMQYLWQRTSNITAALQYLPVGVGAAIFIADHSDDANTKLFAAAQLLALGQLLVAIKHDDEANDILSQARNRFIALDDLKGHGATLIAIAHISSRNGKLDQAEELCSSARQLFAAADDLEGEASALHALGAISRVRQDYDVACQRESDALELYRELGLEREQGVVLIELADIAQDRGNLEESARNLRVAKDILERSGTPMDLAACLHRLGRLTLYFGNSPTDRDETNVHNHDLFHAQRAQEATPYFQTELALLLGTFDFDAYARVTYELSVAYRWMARGDIDKNANLELSQKYGELAVEAIKKGHARNLLANALTNLAALALLQGKRRESERKYREALRLLHSRQDALGIAVVSRDLGVLLITKFGKREEGCQLLVDAVRHFERLGRHDDAAKTLGLRRQLCGERQRT